MINPQTTDPERVVLSGALSDGASFRLAVSGPYRRREIDLITRHLEVMKDAVAQEIGGEAENAEA